MFQKVQTSSSYVQIRPAVIRVVIGKTKWLHSEGHNAIYDKLTGTHLFAICIITTRCSDQSHWAFNVYVLFSILISWYQYHHNVSALMSSFILLQSVQPLQQSGGGTTSRSDGEAGRRLSDPFIHLLPESGPHHRLRSQQVLSQYCGRTADSALMPALKFD